MSILSATRSLLATFKQPIHIPSNVRRTWCVLQWPLAIVIAYEIAFVEMSDHQVMFFSTRDLHVIQIHTFETDSLAKFFRPVGWVHSRLCSWGMETNAVVYVGTKENIGKPIITRYNDP
jgi:hypothetical protein